MLAKHLVNGYQIKGSRIHNLLQSRAVYIVPMLNPDGKEHDIRDGSYHYWRKNLRYNDNRSLGVDLNRNYSYEWGTVGASPVTSRMIEIEKGRTPELAVTARRPSGLSVNP